MRDASDPPTGGCLSLAEIEAGQPDGAASLRRDTLNSINFNNKLSTLIHLTSIIHAVTNYPNDVLLIF